ncbi:MAG: asparaginase [Caldimonas sp.]
MRTVVVLGTGGTIAGSAPSADDNVGYAAGTVGVDALVASARHGGAVAVETEQVAQLDSKDMDVATWLALARRVAHHAGRAEVAGVVVTHGSDTLEETAYFLSRVVPLGKPVVLTAAMRPATSRQADGPQNLADAIAVAALDGNAGVVVVLAGTVHSAHDVRKVHPYRLDAFSSGDAGPLARIEEGRMRVFRLWPVEAAFAADRLPADASAWPWIEIVTSAAAADGRAVASLVNAGVEGIVVAATGNGTLHRDLGAALAAAAGRGVAVLRSTRCLDGSIIEAGAGEFAAAGDLPPVKARVELMLRLLAARGEPRAGGT